MFRVIESDPALIASYEMATRDEWYGDLVLAQFMRQRGVQLKIVWPMLNGEKPITLPYRPTGKVQDRHWCQPIITMHHVTPEERNAIWHFEQQRDRGRVGTAVTLII